MSSNDRQKLIQVSAWAWAYYNQIQLHSGAWTMVGHEYLLDVLASKATVEVIVKGSQMGFTVAETIKLLHAALYGEYPQGVGIIFPTSDMVDKFSVDRWGPMINLNPVTIGQYVSVNQVNFKIVGKTNIHFRGAKMTEKLEGTLAHSGQTMQWSADMLVFDEKDKMEPIMVGLMETRMGHTFVNDKKGYKVFMGTPAIPGFGILKDYENTTQHVWTIKCPKCNKETCLDLTFPDCLVELKSGEVARMCPKCRDHGLNPRAGYWVAQYPNRDKVGRWISRLNTGFADLKMILDCLQNPQNHDGGLQKLYNNELARGYVASENKLETEDVYACCSWDGLQASHKGPTAIGVDVGKQFHVTVAVRPNAEALKLIYVTRVTEIEDVREICLRFNAGCVMMDLEPDTHTARRFQREMDVPVWLCDEQGTRKKPPGWSDDDMTYSANRTEMCDMVVQLVREKGQIILPQRCEEIEIFARELSNTCKVREEDKVTGSVKFKWKKLGDDHYFHSLLFCIMASDRIPVATDRRMLSPLQGQQQTHADTTDQEGEE